MQFTAQFGELSLSACKKRGGLTLRGEVVVHKRCELGEALT
jgi:hypothetical protein